MPQHKSGAKAQNVEPNRANYHDPRGDGSQNKIRVTTVANENTSHRWGTRKNT